MRFRSAVLLSLLVSISACATPTNNGAVISSGDRYLPPAGVESYKLGVGDKVKVTVFNETSLSGEFAVGSDGNLALPLVGAVPAAGLTTSDVAATFQQRLADGFLRLPRVSAEVSQYRPFFILGEVSAPGQYPYLSGLSAYSAVATAKGFTPRADTKILHIRREGEAEEKTYRITPDLRIYPGDIIRVGERYF